MRSFTYIVAVFLLAATTISASTLAPGLNQTLQEAEDNQAVSIVVFLENTAINNDVAKVAHNQSLSRSDRLKSVVNRLNSYAHPYETEIVEFLNEYTSTLVKRHWIVPAYTATIPANKVQMLSRMNGVKTVIENVSLVYESPVEVSPAPQTVSAAISSHLVQLNVPYLWQRGLKGNGRLVCSFDTGVQQSHPALADKWRGNVASLGESWFSKIKPDSLPFDATGHGTHTMGIVVGATPTDSFGVAPEAQWITAGVIDQGSPLSVTISDILDAFQWALNPDGDINTINDVPDVILNSWGLPKGLFQPCDETFWMAIDNVEAAGIVTIFSAGNEGPDPMTLRAPADRASTPLNSFAVGAVDASNNVGSFSSRGPSSCDTTQIKPEVVAPGVSIRSSTRNDAYAYMTGTSMAAPYIAGIVTLIRQYNPEATVAQIKQALIASARDLGVNGDDNAYGHGLVDAATVLDYIPSPFSPEFTIANTALVDSELALPGEAVSLRLTLNNPVGNVNFAAATMEAIDAGVSILDGTTDFLFGEGGTIAMNVDPLEIDLDRSLYHGQQLTLRLILDSDNQTFIDTLLFSLSVGIEPNGVISEHRTERLSLEVSDFGQFGFAPGSLYNLNKTGFTFDNSPNLLYEAGLVIGRSSLQMAKGIRDESGSFKQSDFLPVRSLTTLSADADGAINADAAFSDALAAIPLPIQIEQTISTYQETAYSGMMIFEYTIVNNTIENLTNIGFGMFTDFDLSADDTVLFDSEQQLIYQTDANGHYIGLVGLKNMAGFITLRNENGKTGFTNSQLYSYLGINGAAVSQSAGDLMMMISSGKFSLIPNSSRTTAFALVIGTTVSELYENVSRAKEKYLIATDITDFNDIIIPSGFSLSQNYPNPFNPTTTIEFALPVQSEIAIAVYNTLGQKVKTLHEGRLAAGNYEVMWDGTNRSGEAVASGMYFYRMVTDSFTKTQKMILMK